jgi:hypothetical protein
VKPWSVTLPAVNLTSALTVFNEAIAFADSRSSVLGAGGDEEEQARRSSPNRAQARRTVTW